MFLSLNSDTLYGLCDVSGVPHVSPAIPLIVILTEDVT